MKNRNNFNDILNECIERILRGDSVEACLKSFPEHAAGLEPLLRTAADTHRAVDILPRPEFRQRAGYEFQVAIRDIKPARAGLFRWPLRWVAAVSVMIAVLLAGSGTVAAAANSLPDESLYGVKLFTEEMRVALTPSVLGKAQLYSDFADTRVEEIIKMADKGKVEGVVQATEQMNNNLAAIAKLIKPEDGVDSSAGRGEPQLMMTARESDMNKAGVQEGPETAPVLPPGFSKAPAPDAADQETLATSNQSRSKVMAAEDKNAPANAKSNGNKFELKNNVLNQSAKNTQALQDVLERVPESVRPSVEKAIEVARNGYEEALKNTGNKNK